MSGWMSCCRGRKDLNLTARKAIATLRQQLQMLEKEEEYHLREIKEELKKAKANIISNKPAAAAALRRKKAHETELERLSGTRLTLETQVFIARCLTNANFNVGFGIERGPAALSLRAIHGKLKIDDVDKIMDSAREQMELTNEITRPISNPMNVGVETDEPEEDLKIQLAELEADEVLRGPERVPPHIPSASRSAVGSRNKTEQEAEEEQELRELQAQLAL
ncbi:ESCRT-III subunit protein snf7 [Tulasnella sp. 424]|nr:ESCRT-III subunit protein snf7 [Tulasnella sp. 424]